MRSMPPYGVLRNYYSCSAAACSCARRVVGSILNLVTQVWKLLVGNTANNKPSIPSINQLPTPVSGHAPVIRSTRTRDFHPSTRLPLLRPVNNTHYQQSRQPPITT